MFYLIHDMKVPRRVIARLDVRDSEHCRRCASARLLVQLSRVERPYGDFTLSRNRALQPW